MKVYCKQTAFVENIKLWELGKFYDYKQQNDYEKEYVYMYVKCDSSRYWVPMDKKKFDKHF